MYNDGNQKYLIHSKDGVIPEADMFQRQAGMFDVTLLITCYNEADTVTQTADVNLEALQECGLRVEIIFIDDLSSDNSVEVIKAWQKEKTGLVETYLVERLVNAGLGSNFRLGCILARGNCFRLTCGDLPEPLAELKRIYRLVDKTEMVLPFHCEVENKSNTRLLVSKIYTSLINLITGKKISYYNGQPIVPINSLHLAIPTTSGFGFQAEMVGQLLIMDTPYQEIGIKTHQRGETTAVSLGNVMSVVRVSIILLMARLAKSYHSNRIS